MNEIERFRAAQNALGQPTQPLGNRGIVGAPAIAQNAGLGAALLGVPDVLGQLQVGDHAAVGPLLLGFAQIHMPNAIDNIGLQSMHTG